MGQNSTRLDCGKIGDVEEKAMNKRKHTKNNKFGSRSFREDRNACTWRFRFAWNMSCSICSHRAAIWNQTRINCKQIKIVKEAINNTKTEISGSTDGSKFSTQHLKLFAKL